MALPPSTSRRWRGFHRFATIRVTRSGGSPNDVAGARCTDVRSRRRVDDRHAGGRVRHRRRRADCDRIGENTRLTLSPIPARSEFSARLFFGNLWARVHKLASGETFRVETENAVAGVRGTEFRVEAGQEQPDLVRVYEGTVQVEARDGRWSHALEAGTGLRFRREAEGPHIFDGEGGHPFMEWVRSRKTADGVEPGRIRRAETRNPEQEHRTRERVRRRDR
ncbi:MAG: FecR domain-containing protein [Deltaproteobacteria bacterium]|nr:MAG: FecR domain-containing protein [Deltaproteobacteria bacterium]